MKTLLILIWTCLIFVVGAFTVNAAGNELHISVELTTGERSKDSGSETTTITVERNVIVWERTASGHRVSGGLPMMKKFRLSPTDKGNLLKLIRSNNLLVTDSIELPQDASNFRYFEISVDLTLDEKKGTISIGGPRTAVMVKEETLYQNSVALVKELFRIINSQDKSVQFEELILRPIRR